MKVINKTCQVLAILFGVTAAFLFFTNFATIRSATGTYDVAGSILAFGGKLTAAGVSMYKSSDLLFCFLSTLVAVACAGFTFKSKGARYFSPAFALLAAIYMLVVTLSAPSKFIDCRPLEVAAATDVTYCISVLLATIALFVCFGFGTAHLLIDDYIIVSASKGQLTIPQKVVRFIRDYKSETKKIVWPGLHDVIKNTIIVLIMCAIVGLFIWLVDFGLGSLLEVILKNS